MNSFAGQTEDLTGIWQDENGVSYHIRQVGSRIYWMADKRPEYVHVFSGTLQGNMISGSWSDLPGGRLRHSGSLTLRVDSTNRIIVLSSQGDRFTGTRLDLKESEGFALSGPGGDIDGTWRWGNGAIVNVSPGGKLTSGTLTGDWRLVDSGARRYSFSWANGYTDTMTLSSDGNRLNGQNNRGSRVYANRAGFDDASTYSGGEEIAGTWKWHNGETVSITADGLIDAGRVKGEWKLTDKNGRLYTLTWNNGYTDTMTLSSGGNRLDGKNRRGGTVWGERISAGDSRKPWETPEGQACFEAYIREVERRLNSYDGGPEHNGRKPWFINQWGVLNSRSGFGPTSDRAPDDFSRYDNRYHYMWFYWHRTSPAWGKKELDGAGIPDIWEYVNNCLTR